MKFKEASLQANRLNAEGAHKEGWFYYAACHDGGAAGEQSQFFGEWFVMRRPKGTMVLVAVFTDGGLRFSERIGL